MYLLVLINVKFMFNIQLILYGMQCFTEGELSYKYTI